MKAGSLRHRVDIETVSGNRDARGNTVRTFAVEYPSVPASIRALSGQEVEHARQLFANATHEIIVRYHAGVTTANRIKFGERYFEIGFVDNMEERGIMLRLTCTEARD